VVTDMPMGLICKFACKKRQPQWQNRSANLKKRFLSWLEVLAAFQLIVANILFLQLAGRLAKKISFRFQLLGSRFPGWLDFELSKRTEMLYIDIQLHG